MNAEEQKEFEELSTVVKAHGYMKLNTMEKRHRYSELKKKVDGDTETVTVSKNELQAMIDKRIDAYKEEAKRSYVEEADGLDEAKKIGKWIKSKAPKVQNSTAKLRVYREDGMADGGLIIDSKFLKNAFNEESRKYDVPMYRLWVRYDDEQIKEYDVPLSVWSQINEFEVVEIIKKDIVKEEMSRGMGIKPFTKGGYSFSSPGLFSTKEQASGEAFEYIETRDTITCTVRRPSGGTFTIDALRLN